MAVSFIFKKERNLSKKDHIRKQDNDTITLY